jgi:hypothetical protein
MFRFTIRELVLLTLVVAMGVGWWVDRSRLTELNRMLKDQQTALRMAALRAQELRGEIILSASPD